MIDTSKIEVEINPDYTMLKKVNNNLYLSQEEMDILDSYNINYKQYKNLSELIYEVENIYDDTDDDILANLLDVLSERDYYENFNK